MHTYGTKRSERRAAPALLRRDRGGAGVSLVLHPEELDGSGRVLRAIHPVADPAGVGHHVVGLSSTGGDDLIVQLAGQRQGHEPAALHLPPPLATLAVPRAPPAAA